jgi:hypothetical protein
VRASEAMRTLVTAVVDMPDAFANEVKENVEEWRCFSKLALMPLFSPDPHRWCDIFSTAGSEFREVVDAWLIARKGAVHHPARGDGDGGRHAVCADLVLPYACEGCSGRFGSNRHLACIKT